MGRTREITDASGNTVTYEWGTLGERTGVVYPDGQKITYQYDQYLNLKEVTAGEDTTVYLHDENGRLSGKQYANGMRSHYTYTAEGRLESLTHEDREGISDRFYYTYDAVGNCIGEERERRNLPEESGSYRYIYDVLGRLTGIEKDGMLVNHYEYDAYGNRTAEKRNGEDILYIYNEGNQLIKKESQSGIQDYLYDANGNLMKVMQADGVQAEYHYDSTDNMISAKTGRGTAEYGYNGFGKKVSMEIKRAESGIPEVSGRTDYILDYTRDYNNLLQRKYGNRTDTYFWDNSLLCAASDTESGQGGPVGNMVCLSDLLGSPLRFCNTEGNTAESYSYGMFGENPSGQKETAALQSVNRMQPFGFAGYERDDISGFYHAQARRYDAENGRFTSRDMIKGYTSRLQSQNEYAYCVGNPLLYVDRDGREPQFVSGDGYETIGYDGNGTPIIRKKEEERTKEEKIKDAELLDQTYDAVNDGLGIANEAGNIVIAKSIKESPRPKNIGGGTWNKKIAGELAEQAKFYSKAGKVLEKMGYIGVGVDVIVGAYNNVQEGTSWQRTASDAFVDLTFSLFIALASIEIGTYISALIGGAIGTGILPGAGTVGGAIAGGAVGAAVYSIIIAQLLDWLLNEKEVYNGKSLKENVKESLWYTFTVIGQKIEGILSCELNY